MNATTKHIIGWCLLAVFLMNGVVAALPALFSLSSKQEVAELVESSESSTEKEEKLGEREVVRDHQHELDIEIGYIGTPLVINSGMYKPHNWPVVYLPVFTPPPEV